MFAKRSQTKSSTTNKQRIMALLVCAAILLVALLSTVFLVQEVNHICTGANCPVCAGIQQCKTNLRQMGAGVSGQQAAAAAVLWAVFAVFSFTRLTLAQTPVSQRVRLNN